MKRKIAILLATAALIVFIATAYAINVSFMVHQTLTVPSSSSMAVYQSDGFTTVNNGALISSLWLWTGSQFTLTLVIHNTGNIVLVTGLNTTDVPFGWLVTINGNGTLPMGGVQTVTLIALPYSTAGGTTSGDFDLWLTG